jgi:16S rRNA processing protein RimM
VDAPAIERMARWDEMVVVGRIARPHGIRGQVIVNPETDFPEQRFQKGASFWIRSSQGDGQVTIGSVRFQGGRPVVGFEGFERIEDVERLAGLELRIPEEELTELEPGLFYHHQLVGCVVEMPDGLVVGTVSRIEGGLGGSRLVVDGQHGEILVPLATEICVEIDIAARRIRIQPPEGLLDLNVTRR